MHTVSWHSVGTTLDECIKCNICTSYCPVAAVTDKFPGPKYVGPQAQRFREIGQLHTPDHSVDYCSACRVCNEVCPTGVKIAEINARAKAQIVADKGIPLRNWFLGRNEMLGKIGSYRAAPGEPGDAQPCQPIPGRKGHGHRSPRADPALEHRGHLRGVVQADARPSG